MNIWDILGIEPTNNIKEIRKRYAELVKEYHPEEHPKEYQQIMEAYQLAMAYARKSKASRSSEDVTEKPGQKDTRFEKEGVLPFDKLAASKPFQTKAEEQRELASSLDFSSLFFESQGEQEESSEAPSASELDFNAYKQFDRSVIEEELEDLLQLDVSDLELLREWKAFFNRYRSLPYLLIQLLDELDVYAIVNPKVVHFLINQLSSFTLAQKEQFYLTKLKMWYLVLTDLKLDSEVVEKIRETIEEWMKFSRLLSQFLATESLINNPDKWKELYTLPHLKLDTFAQISQHYHKISNAEALKSMLEPFESSALGYEWMTEDMEQTLREMWTYYLQLRYPNSSKTFQKRKKVEVLQQALLAVVFLFMSALSYWMSIVTRVEKPWLQISFLTFFYCIRYVWLTYYSKRSPKIKETGFVNLWSRSRHFVYLLLASLILPTFISPFVLVIYYGWLNSGPVQSIGTKWKQHLDFSIPVSVAVLSYLFSSLAYLTPDVFVNLMICFWIGFIVLVIRFVFVPVTEKSYQPVPNRFIGYYLLPMVTGFGLAYGLNHWIKWLHLTATFDQQFCIMSIILLLNSFLLGDISVQKRSFYQVAILFEPFIFQLFIIIKHFILVYHFELNPEKVMSIGDNLVGGWILFYLLEVFVLSRFRTVYRAMNQ